MEWEEKFDEFVKEKNISIGMDGLVSPIKEMKSFIKLALASQKGDIRKEVENMRRPQRGADPDPYCEDFKELVREKAEEATGQILKSLREDNLTRDEASEWYGYIRGIRDLIYTLNLQKHGESKTNDDLQIALVYLRTLTK